MNYLKSNLLLLLIFNLGVLAKADFKDPEFQEFEHSWLRIMFDLKKVMSQQVVSGPGIDQSFEFYEIKNPPIIQKIASDITLDAKSKFLHLAQNMSFKTNSDLYLDEYQKKVSLEKYNQMMWDQFVVSFERELKVLKSERARGHLMGQFTSVWRLHGPLMDPMVFYSWFAQRRVWSQVSQFAIERIWLTGNPIGIQEFIPLLFTNRMSEFTLIDNLQSLLDPNKKIQPYSELQGWLTKYPQQTKAAILKVRKDIEFGPYQRASFLRGDVGNSIWLALPESEILHAILTTDGELKDPKACSNLFDEQ